jgi:hypothetical protein
LAPANVTPSGFGRVFSLPVDAGIAAQPLYVPGLAIPGQGTHNVLFVATMKDSIYAFDADTPGAPLWAINYATAIPGAAPVSIVDLVSTDSFNMAGPVGIESTPVIDPATNTMYFVTNTREVDTFVFRLHAVDITTGAEKFGGPTVIQGSFTAGGKTITFTPSLENQRASLTLAKGNVIVSFSSHEDYYQYYGWVMAYSAQTLAQTGVFCPTPTDDHGGAVWQSGRPPVVDTAGDVYLFVGNAFAPTGTTNTWDGVTNFTESALRLDPAQGLKLIDYFTPQNYLSMDAQDQDLSSSGPTLIPGTDLLVGGGKYGTVYLLNTQNMGQLQVNDAGAVQASAVSAGEIRGGPAYWARSTAAGGPLIFNWGAYDALKAFSFNGSTFNPTPVATFTPSVNLYPGGELTVSSNGDQSGIVWAIIVAQGDADHRVPPGELLALNAANVSQQLWSSTGNAARDDFGLMAKWVPPVVANGKVYVATASNQVVVYGLLNSTGLTATAWPPQEFALGGTADYVVSALSSQGTSQSATWTVAGLPAGSTGSFIQDAQGQTVLHVVLGSATPRGSYRLQATATAGGQSVTQSVLLDVPDATAVVASTATADNAQSGNPATNAIDGSPVTFWTTTASAYPHEITIDLGTVQPVSGISYLPRQDGCINGTVLQYEVHLSVDGVNWLPETTGGSFNYGPQWYTYSCSGSFMLPKRQTIAFPVTTARYVQLVGLGSVIDGNPWDSAAEIQVFAAQNQVPVSGPYVFASRLTDMALSVSALSATAGLGIVQYPYTGVANQVWSVAPAATAGNATLTSSGSQLVLDVAQASTASGAALDQASGNGGTNQQFALTPYGDGRGFYAIQPLNSGACVSLLNSSTASGTSVVQLGCNYGMNQLWSLTPASAALP